MSTGSECDESASRACAGGAGRKFGIPRRDFISVVGAGTASLLTASLPSLAVATTATLGKRFTPGKNTGPRRLLQPEILLALAEAGPGSRVLIAEGNYPFSTQSPASAKNVFLNLRRGMVKATEVLEVLRDTIPIEKVILMATPDGKPAPIHHEFFKLLRAGVNAQTLSRAEFYPAANQPETALVIATGEDQPCANLLLTIGVAPSDQL